MSASDESRLMRIEERVAHLERLLQQLDEAVRGQERRLRQLGERLEGEASPFPSGPDAMA